MSAEQPPVWVLAIAFTLTAPLAVCALGTGQQVDVPDPPAPTRIERALIERACRATDTPLSDFDAHRQCLSAQLLSLRTDFGLDLSRLAGADRRRIDTACNRLQASEQREAYLDCLGGQLVTLHNRRNRATPAASEDAAVAISPLPEPAVADMPAARKASSGAMTAAIAGTVAGVLAVGGAVFVAVRSRRGRRPCRVCGVAVPDSDLCAACRHEAAEALRRAATERADSLKAQEEEARRQQERQADQREQRARDEEEARVREQELARQLQAEEDARRQSLAVAPVGRAAEEHREEVFNPYLVLGVPCEAGPDDIRTAYEQAKTKCDPDLVSFLGDEAQAHFKAKAESVERAYQMLSEVRP